MKWYLGFIIKDDPVQWEQADTDETEELATRVLPGMRGSGCSSVLVCVLTFPLRRLLKVMPLRSRMDMSADRPSPWVRYGCSEKPRVVAALSLEGRGLWEGQRLSEKGLTAERLEDQSWKQPHKPSKHPALSG